MVAQDALAQGVLGVAQHAEGIAAQSVDESGSGAGQAVKAVQVLEKEQTEEQKGRALKQQAESLLKAY